ncbi:hypothetical protein JVT61DRAFT_7049 [Boletus reticuloceps]|uniref:Uncharacterized protein n=1 Tax=Boletus reticuloceps TaxID=495285 RepID=A0A8I2YJ59_9AGAM|nr:hypothetical protein JVT61DRAFT_7049 [Boletus reticuloceps]
MSTTFNAETFLGQNGYGLNTLELSVRFHGALYFRDAPEQVPVHVSIRLSDEWATVLPSVQDVSKEKLAAKKPLTLWQQLTKQIEHCLVADPLLDSKHPECYRLMRELFWMAFIAAYPDFPRGKWLRWNALIPMEGDFISHWMLKDEDTELPDIPIHVVIWEQFRSIISDTLLIHCVQ